MRNMNEMRDPLKSSNWWHMVYYASEKSGDILNTGDAMRIQYGSSNLNILCLIIVERRWLGNVNEESLA